MRKWTYVTLGVIAFLLWVALGHAFAAPRKTVDQKTFNAVMNHQYPNGRGPNSTSRARGFYRGLDGNWRHR